VALVVLIGLGVGVVIGRRSTMSEPVQRTVVIPQPEVQTVSNDPHEQDLNVWLQHWVAATQGRDPEAQTKFYADPVTWYFRTPHVDQATLLALKQIAPENNNASTMVEIEDLKVTHQTSDSASVQFRRRFLVESTQGRLNERVVPARLKVNRIDGDWKITEEHNLQ
jgi:ketosteroid isomerase-like protein